MQDRGTKSLPPHSPNHTALRLSLSAGETSGGSGEAEEGARSAILLNYSLSGKQIMLPGSGQMKKDERAYCEKTSSGDQRSHPREGLDFWRKDRQREKKGISTFYDLTPRWSSAVPG